MAQPWFVLAGITMTVAAVLAFGAARRGRSGVAAWLAAAANLSVAALNSVAPYRAPLDPHYVGYRFGLLTAKSGWLVTVIAGTVVLAAVTAAIIAARNRGGAGMKLVVAVDTALCLVLLGGLFDGSDLSRFSLQFGEHLTIPGLAGLAVIAGMILLPLGGAAVWAARRAGRGALTGA